MTKTAKTTEESAPTFEVALEQLQAAVKKMESGELNLEDSLKCFEDGVRLTKFCQAQLQAAEQKVELLMKGNPNDTDAPPTQPFPSGSRNG